jgi:agmatine/peptidylarginine deiminase
MITDNLTNTVFFSSLLPEKCPILNAHIKEALQKRGIPFFYLLGTKDIWCRDYMPIQIDEGRFFFYKYTPDYLQDKKGLLLQTSIEDVLEEKVNQLQSLRGNNIAIDLVIDGGNVVKCGDKIVMTEKVFFENKNKSCWVVSWLLNGAFESQIIFLPWDKKEKFGHCDGIIHYIGKGKVLLTNYEDFSPYYYRRFRKALEEYFEVIPLTYNVKRKHQRSWAYINFLQIGSLVLVPQLGMPEDEQALEQISIALPDCEVVGIPALEAVRRGGALNCISWNIKA